MTGFIIFWNESPFLESSSTCLFGVVNITVLWKCPRSLPYRYPHTQSLIKPRIPWLYALSMNGKLSLNLAVRIIYLTSLRSTERQPIPSSVSFKFQSSSSFFKTSITFMVLAFPLFYSTMRLMLFYIKMLFYIVLVFYR